MEHAMTSADKAPSQALIVTESLEDARSKAADILIHIDDICLSVTGVNTESQSTRNQVCEEACPPQQAFLPVTIDGLSDLGAILNSIQEGIAMIESNVLGG